MTPEELKKIRAVLELTQGQLAEELGVARNTVARWEMGARKIPEPAARLVERLLKEGKVRKRKR